jgi:hypothetical protein
MARWTQAQFEKAELATRLVMEEKDAEFEAIVAQLRSELDEATLSALLEYADKLYANQRKASEQKAKPKALPRRGAQATESWRCLGTFPNYEISSYGRVRSLDRARPDAWLKPRRRWMRGSCVDYVALVDSHGRRCERQIGWLLVSVGFMVRPKWAARQ